MEPRIQYAKTEDGVSIAYASRGQGPVLVFLPVVWEQFTLTWQLPAHRDFLEQLGQGRRLVQYDRRGFGLSQREVTELSLDTEAADLDAVLRALKLRSVSLFASALAGPGAIAYAARHPRIVRNLILYGTFSRADDVMPPERLEAFINLLRTDWSRAAQFFADSTARELHPEETLQLAKDYRQSASGENAAKLLASRFDVDDLLPQVRSRILVIHRRGDALIPFSAGQKIAAKLPNAQFVPLEGIVHPYFLGDTQAVVDAIDDFLQQEDVPPAKAEHVEATKPAEADVYTILFTDMESSTALTQRLGDAKAHEVRRTHNVIVRDALKAHGGSEIKHTGDGIMASFPTASSALECSIAIQKGVASHKEEHSDSPLGVYIGLNAGEPIAEDDPGGRVDLFGTSIDLAARICDHAAPGQIVASNVVRELAAGKQFLFDDLGETELRGFEDPVRLYELRWRE